MSFEKCKTCRYYMEHYIKQPSRYHPIGGHCINEPLNEHKRKHKFELVENCGYWENDETVKQERKERITEVIRDMEEHLSEIILILKDDDK